MDLIVAIKALDTRRRRGIDGIPARLQHRSFDRRRQPARLERRKGRAVRDRDSICGHPGGLLAVPAAAYGPWSRPCRAIAKSQRFTLNLLLAFLPAAVLGVIFISTIKKYLFAPVPVATAFIVGGILILWIESRKRTPRIDTVDGVKPADAVWIGFAQALSMIPGTSRSGATIMGGLLRGLSRPAATEFSFFLAIPTILGATVLSLYKARHSLNFDDLAVIGVGSVASFISAAFAVTALLRYVSGHNFKVFAWYRIAFGLLILGTWYFGLVKWR